MESTDLMSLGTFISKRRQFLRMTQEQLAEELHVSKSAIAKWETDRGIPDRENLKKLAEKMGVSADILYHLIDMEDVDPDNINITRDIVAVLESYGYVVVPPNERN